MIKEDFLKDLKSEYKKTNATWHLKIAGWDDISKKIGLSPPLYKRIFNNNLIRVSLTFATFLLLFFGAIKGALAAMPGTSLYPIKILSERFVGALTGSNQLAIDNRADEIVALTKKNEINNQQLKEVVIEYKANVEEVQKQIQVSGKPNIEFQKKLEEQHSRFDNIIRENPKIEEEIKDAQDISNHREDDEED